MGKRRLEVGQRWRVLSDEFDLSFIMRVIYQISPDKFVLLKERVPIDELSSGQVYIFGSDGNEATWDSANAFYLDRKLQERP